MSTFLGIHLVYGKRLFGPPDTIYGKREICAFLKGKCQASTKMFQDIQLKSYEWIVRRTKKKSEINWQEWPFQPQKCQIL